MRIFSKPFNCYRLGLLVVSVIIASMSVNAFALVNWQFQFGGMYGKRYGAGGELRFNNDGKLIKENDYSLKGAILLQIPLSHTSPLFIETGLGYRNNLILSEYDRKFNSEITKDQATDFGVNRGHFMELPLKLGYKLKLNNKSAVDFGVGPYLNVAAYGYEDSGYLNAGLNLSAAYRYRCMSYGVEWQNPIFINGSHNYYKNSFMVTIGVNIRGRKINVDWEKLANALDATGSAMQTMISAYENTTNDAEVDDSYSSSPNNFGSQTSAATSGNKFSLSEQQAYNSDKRTYERYDSQLSSHYAGNQTMSLNSVTQAKRKMKQLREKWTKRGKSWTKSQYDTL